MVKNKIHTHHSITYYARILNVGLPFIDPESPNRTMDPGTVSCWRSVASGLIMLMHPSIDLKWTVPLGFMHLQVSGQEPIYVTGLPGVAVQMSHPDRNFAPEFADWICVCQN